MSELTHCSICGCTLEDEAECYEVENDVRIATIMKLLSATIAANACFFSLYSSITITIGGVQLVE